MGTFLILNNQSFCSKWEPIFSACNRASDQDKLRRFVTHRIETDRTSIDSPAHPDEPSYYIILMVS